MSTFCVGFQWRHDVQFRVDFIPNCLLLFTWDALISKYHQIWSQHSLFSPLSVGITVATVKTNLIIIQVMFFGISVHLPANFDGICSTHSRPAQHISCQTAELGSVITPGVQLGTRHRRLPRELLDTIYSSHQSCGLSLRNQSWLGLNHVLLLWWLDHAMIRDNNRLQWKFATSTTACGGE